MASHRGGERTVVAVYRERHLKSSSGLCTCIGTYNHIHMSKNTCAHVHKHIRQERRKEERDTAFNIPE